MRNISPKDVVLPIVFFAFLILGIANSRAVDSGNTVATGSTIETVPATDGKITPDQYVQVTTRQEGAELSVK